MEEHVPVPRTHDLAKRITFVTQPPTSKIYHAEGDDAVSRI